jgi:hypothetical protein
MGWEISLSTGLCQATWQYSELSGQPAPGPDATTCPWSYRLRPRGWVGHHSQFHTSIPYVHTIRPYYLYGRHRRSAKEDISHPYPAITRREPSPSRPGPRRGARQPSHRHRHRSQRGTRPSQRRPARRAPRGRQRAIRPYHTTVYELHHTTGTVQYRPDSSVLSLLPGRLAAVL